MECYEEAKALSRGKELPPVFTTFHDLEDYPADKSGDCNVEEQTMPTIEPNQKLRFAIWDHIEFLSEVIGIDDPKQVVDIIRKCVEEYISEYSPADESFEAEFED